MLVVLLGNNITGSCYRVSVQDVYMCVAFVGDEIMMFLSLTSELSTQGVVGIGTVSGEWCV